MIDDLTTQRARAGLKLIAEPAPAAQSIEMALTPLADLRIHPAYQRKISDGGMSRIRKIISGFQWARFGALSVSRDADGTLWVVDGQHRMIAARALHLTEVPCIITHSDLQDQARDFVGINSVRTSVASIDKFRARVTSGDETALAVASLLDTLAISTDIAAGASLKPRETRAVSLLEKLVKRHDAGSVGDALEIMLDAQPDQPNLLTAFNIEAVATVYMRMLDAKRDTARLQAALVETDFESLKDNAGQLVKLQGGKTAQRGAELLLREVNKGLREKVA